MAHRRPCRAYPAPAFRSRPASARRAPGAFPSPEGAALFGLFVKDIEKSFPHFFADRSFSSSRMTLSLMRSVLV